MAAFAAQMGIICSQIETTSQELAVTKAEEVLVRMEGRIVDSQSYIRRMRQQQQQQQQNP